MEGRDASRKGQTEAGPTGRTRREPAELLALGGRVHFSFISVVGIASLGRETPQGATVLVYFREPEGLGSNKIRVAR